MKIITKYVASDETVFDTREDCENYEKKLNSIWEKLWNNILFFDSFGKPMLYTDWQSMEDIYSMSSFVLIKRNLTENECDAILKNRDICIPCDSGLYRYLDNENRWIEFDEDLSRFIQETWCNLEYDHY